MTHGRGWLGFVVSIAAAVACAQGVKPKDLMPHQEGIAPTPGVKVAPSGGGFAIEIPPGKEDYPGITIAAPGGSWNLAAFGHIEAKVTNTGAKAISLALRVDGDGPWQDNPWNAESIYLQPGQSGTVSTIFGYSYGHKPGYRLNPVSVLRVLLFANKSAEPQSFRLESLLAAGSAGEKPPIAPEDVRIVPENGVLIDRAIPLRTQAILDPAVGCWDLRDADEVRIAIRNRGKKPVDTRAMIRSKGGDSEWVSATLEPNSETTIAIPFAGPAPMNLGANTGGGKIASDAVSAIELMASAELEVVRAVAESVPATLPGWLGRRPPVPGDWIKTLDDEFAGNTLDRRVWRNEGENYYDKVTHWSKHNVVLGGGAVRLRYEKKRGYQNDDPKRNETAYASGYLDTYGLWAQRYGYFEARMKLPTAPGLWPAFWMMPDRGPSAGEQWKRQDTANGGMEFDIMEHLTRWGRHRYNIAMHYDGYAAEHKSLGSDKVYCQPDKDGYITCGLLWTPGSAVYYCNGREVLRWDNARVSSVPAILMFTLPSGGWDNSALDDSRLPDDFTIDYVRVWQRKDLASGADGTPR